MKHLQTFQLPQSVTTSSTDIQLARDMIHAWRQDGIFQVAVNSEQHMKTERAFHASKRFFRMPLEKKSRCVSDLSFSGYVACGEEITAGKVDHSEIFTVCPDIPDSDWRVKEGWPCHGPVPWPDQDYELAMKAFMKSLGEIGDNLLRLVAIGLGLGDINHLTDVTRNGWHHMRVLRFASAGAQASSRGIGAHTDYGLLVIAAQEDIPGLYVRPPVRGEKRCRNWLPEESSAGMYNEIGPWNLVSPMPEVLTVFPGDILQFLTNGYLLSTPHKVELHPSKERYALAYFHEPDFAAKITPLNAKEGESIHYGTHFTNMFMRCYPDRSATRRITENGGLAVLSDMRSEDALPVA
ncbi:2-oxoglutarate and iron-dependent oxygenase domain-containing protein [Hahella ganghwensis]|uniref:2-oxoglutarate and iron-dependent oxygenase domain-containing protein n=1 Tax=Hahella ganghwensis TaxID=286420 RepID=UPI000374EBA5|nr:2-oxoglutarate and iron-dependent oxygenase domain-containing protein [Hahella ganghwensis]